MTCSAEDTFNVSIIPTPIVDILTDEVACDSFQLAGLTNGDYFTGTNGSGTPLTVGDWISTTQDIYVYAEDVSMTCSAEDTFNVSIIPNSTS